MSDGLERERGSWQAVGSGDKLFMLIIKVKYWLFNYKLPQLGLAGGWQAWAGREGPVIEDKYYELLRPVLHAIAGLELKK